MRARGGLVIIDVTEHIHVIYQVSRVRIRLPVPGGDLDVDFSHGNHPCRPFLSYVLRSSSCSTLLAYSGEGIGETRNYESVHDRTNRMPRRFGLLRILISVVIKFFVVLRAHSLLKRQ